MSGDASTIKLTFFISFFIKFDIQTFYFFNKHFCRTICTLFLKNDDNPKKIKLVFFGNGSKILDSKFKSNIIFDYDIDLLEENNIDIHRYGCRNYFNLDKRTAKIIIMIIKLLKYLSLFVVLIFSNGCFYSSIQNKKKTYCSSWWV